MPLALPSGTRPDRQDRSAERSFHGPRGDGAIVSAPFRGLSPVLPAASLRQHSLFATSPSLHGLILTALPIVFDHCWPGTFLRIAKLAASSHRFVIPATGVSAAGYCCRTDPPQDIAKRAASRLAMEGDAGIQESVLAVDAPLDLVPLMVFDVPYHPMFHVTESQTTAPPFDAFARGYLTAAERLAKRLPFAPRRNLKKRSMGSRYPEVTTYSCEYNREKWFTRESYHTKHDPVHATWDQFNCGLRVDHASQEADYTPEIFDHRVLARWHGHTEPDPAVLGWVNVNLECKLFTGAGEMACGSREAPVVEMLHHLPIPLHSRVFTVLVLTATKPQWDFSIIVQIPVDLESFPEAFRRTSFRCKSDRLPGLRYLGRHESLHGIRLQPGAYCSVETLRLVDTEEESVHWTMSTVSNAGGKLPRKIQELAVPGKIAKDVSLFLLYNEVKNRPQTAPGRSATALRSPTGEASSAPQASPSTYQIPVSVVVLPPSEAGEILTANDANLSTSSGGVSVSSTAEPGPLPKPPTTNSDATRVEGGSN